jgi:iron complex transport system ATP-binding protein
MGLSIEVAHLSYGYPRQSILLRDISFTVRAGETLCLLGPNGSGKTTLLLCLLAIHQLASGSVSIGTSNIHHMSRKELARKIAYVPQSIATAFPFSVFDMVLMGRTPHLRGFSVASAEDEELAGCALERLGIARLKDRAFNEISGGEQQLVFIARALCQEARVMIMDEPTASLDYGNQIRILQIINELRDSGYAIIVTTHNPDHALLAATHAAIMKDGSIISYGSPDEIITSQNLSDLYATKIHVLKTSFPGEPGGEAKVCIPIM